MIWSQCVGDLVEAPQRRPITLPHSCFDSAIAHGLGLAVGVVGAEPDPQPVGQRDDHRLDLAGRVGPEHLEPARSASMLLTALR